MFTGESEIDTKRRIITIIQKEVKYVFDSSRNLKEAYSLLVDGKDDELESVFAKIRKVEDDVEDSRRALTRELLEIGILMMNKEDVLRAAYCIEDIAGFLTGIAFRLLHIERAILLKRKIIEGLGELIDMAVKSLHKLNDMVKALSPDPASAIQMAYHIQELERQIDDKYRSFMMSIMEMKSPNTVLMLKDIIERVEGLADLCLSSADSLIIVALNL